jgi:hypothetical protein
VVFVAKVVVATAVTIVVEVGTTVVATKGTVVIVIVVVVVVLVVVAIYAETATDLFEPMSKLVIPSLERKVILGVHVPAAEL